MPWPRNHRLRSTTTWRGSWASAGSSFGRATPTASTPGMRSTWACGGRRAGSSSFPGGKPATTRRNRQRCGPSSKDTEYFGPANPAFMVNYIVDDLDGMVADLRAAGVQVEDKQEESDYGRFAWVTDPEGNRIELWQPPSRPA